MSISLLPAHSMSLTNRDAYLTMQDVLSVQYILYQVLGDNKHVDITSHRHFICRWTFRRHTYIVNFLNFTAYLCGKKSFQKYKVMFKLVKKLFKLILETMKIVFT